MLAFGTSYDYYNAVWVKNEWSRYLKLMAKDKTKHLIPCFKNIDAYDMPKEFAKLQAQDLGKVGAIQDLLRGIEKLIPLGNKTSNIKETVIIQQSVTNPTVDSYLKRVFLFLEDKEWKSADEYSEKVLDIDPECAEAYLGKLMVELKVPKRNKLKNLDYTFDDRNNYQKVMRFGNEELINELRSYNVHINERHKKYELMMRLVSLLNYIYVKERNNKNRYDRAVSFMQNAKTIQEFIEASDLLEELNGYRNSFALALECKDKVEEIKKEEAIKSENERKDKELESIKAKMENSKTIEDYELVIKEFETLNGWKDSNECIIECRNRINRIITRIELARIEAERKAEAQRIERERKAEIKRIEAERKAEAERIRKEQKAEAERIKRERKAELARSRKEAISRQSKKPILIIVPMMCVVALFAYSLVTFIIPNIEYNNAITLMNEGNYAEAYVAFISLDGYKDSEEKAKQSNALIYEDKKYNNAITLMNDRNYIEAYYAFVNCYGYKDSNEKATQIYEEYKFDKTKNINVGDYVFLGSYEQNDNTSNGKEYISWLVLDVEDDKALLISKYGLDNIKYRDSVAGEKVVLRTWLNNEFINDAFTNNEMEIIDTSKTTVEDKVFLLSVEEVEKYFETVFDRRCIPTVYANRTNVVETEGYCGWYLRDQNDSFDIEIVGRNVVRSSGEISSKYNAWSSAAIRPAIWVSLER